MAIFWPIGLVVLLLIFSAKIVANQLAELRSLLQVVVPSPLLACEDVSGPEVHAPNILLQGEIPVDQEVLLAKPKANPRVLDSFEKLVDSVLEVVLALQDPPRESA